METRMFELMGAFTTCKKEIGDIEETLCITNQERVTESSKLPSGKTTIITWKQPNWNYLNLDSEKGRVIEAMERAIKMQEKLELEVCKRIKIGLAEISKLENEVGERTTIDESTHKIRGLSIPNYLEELKKMGKKPITVYKMYKELYKKLIVTFIKQRLENYPELYQSSKKGLNRAWIQNITTEHPHLVKIFFALKTDIEKKQREEAREEISALVN